MFSRRRLFTTLGGGAAMAGAVVAVDQVEDRLERLSPDEIIYADAGADHSLRADGAEGPSPRTLTVLKDGREVAGVKRVDVKHGWAERMLMIGGRWAGEYFMDRGSFRIVRRAERGGVKRA